MFLVLTAKRQHLCKRKKVNSHLSKHFPTSITHLADPLNQHILLCWPSNCRERESPGGVGVHSGAASGGTDPCTQHPTSLHSLQLCKTQAPLPWSSTLTKELSFQLSPAQSVLGDYSWPQILFGLLFVLFPLSLF